MALIPCYECKREVSTLAASCPHCGAPVISSKSITSKPFSSQPISSRKEPDTPGKRIIDKLALTTPSMGNNVKVKVLLGAMTALLGFLFVVLIHGLR